jgi:2,3-bisphosphoglycerate-independent phosphoglycerate mutase
VRVLMLFLDGVGIGKRDPHVNALVAARLGSVRSLLGGEIPTLEQRTLSGSHAVVFPLDATLGIPGLPQSGTGQAALFAGLNAARVAGKHFGPYPYSTLKPFLERQNIFRRMRDSGRTPCFANAFPKRFFEYMKHHPSRMSVTALSCTMTGIPLLQGAELEAGDAVSADITNEGWRTLGHPDIEVIEPALAGRRLARLSAIHDFVLFEYWKTDYAGHSQNMKEAIEALERFDAMLGGILDSLDTARTLLVITSDHGNIEDMSVKTHTRHPVPIILYGHKHREAAALLQAKSRPALPHVTPSIMQILGGAGGRYI